MLILLLTPKQARKLRYFLITAQVARNPETIAFLANLKQVLDVAGGLTDKEEMTTIVPNDILAEFKPENLIRPFLTKGR